jgi:hypothetical protein
LPHNLGNGFYDFRGIFSASPISPLHESSMQTLRVNGYDMAYFDVGQGPPLVCVHGSLCDFRIWSAVLGPLTPKHRVIAVSLRHFFPEHWDGVGDTYSIAQHTADVVAFIEDRDNSRHHPSDVRTGAAEILRDRAGVSGQVINPLVVTCSAGPPWMPPAA